MYPFLTGFWISAGASTGMLFVLLFMHQTHPGSSFPEWVFTAISVLVYFSPLIGLWYAWHAFHNYRHRETTRSCLRRRFTGALVGAVVVIVTAYLLLPAVRF